MKINNFFFVFLDVSLNSKSYDLDEQRFLGSFAKLLACISKTSYCLIGSIKLNIDLSSAIFQL